MVSESVAEAMESVCDRKSLYGFYRAVYKGTDCGPMIGFRCNGEWVYGSDLPAQVHDEVEVDGICVSSIVEGSDVEIEPVRFTGEFPAQDFWKAVEAVNEEAGFYWMRDNSLWLHVTRQGDQRPCAWLHWTSWWDEPEWDDVGDLSPIEQSRVMSMVINVNSYPLNVEGGLVVDTWENDATWW